MLADLRLTTAHQRTTGQNLPSALYVVLKRKRKFGHDPQQDPKPRIAILARGSNKLLLCCNGQLCIKLGEYVHIRNLGVYFRSDVR
jgi:hypothetical protein